MKRLFLVLFTIAISTALLAHAPRSVELSYDKDKQELTVEAEHRVRNVENHYIDEIKIYVNGEEVKVKELTVQSLPEKEIQTFSLSLKKGDKVKVVAGCNRVGSRSAEITIN